MTPKERLLAKLADKSAVIGIFGLGYVGLPLALRYAEVGYTVLGFDIDSAKVAALNSGKSYIEHIIAKSVAAARKRKFEATADFWMSRSGERLDLPLQGRGEAKCPHTDERYRVQDGICDLIR